MAYLADDLLTDIRRSGMLPNSSAGATADSDLLAQADKELQTRLLPLVTSVREEWYVRTIDTALTGGQSEYRLPANAIAGKLRQVQLNLNGTLVNVPRFEPGMTSMYSITGSGIPSGYFLRGAAIILLPAPQSGTTLRLSYHHRPGRLAASSTCQAIATASLSGTTWSLTSSSDLSTAKDCVAGTPPFETLADGTVVRTGSATYTLSTAASVGLPAYGPAVGDWLCPAGTSPVVQLPVELHGVLAQRTVARILMQQGHQQEAAQVGADADVMEKEALRLLAVRTEGEGRKMIGGLMFRNRRGALGWGY